MSISSIKASKNAGEGYNAATDTYEDMVAAGRLPHQGLFRQWSVEDETIVNDALDRANLADMRFREVDTLSGGQRQRCWFAMC